MMLSFIEGPPVSAGEDYLVLEAGGLGFRIFVPPAKISALAAQPLVKLHIHMALREDSISLYGFTSAGELEAFRLLLTVTGIGPRLGLALLSAWEVDQLAQIISQGDVKALTTVSGIGLKTAQRICLELKDKLKPVSPDETIGLLTSAEMALVGLGFRAGEVRPVLRALAGECSSLEELVRRALARLTGGGRP